MTVLIVGRIGVRLPSKRAVARRSDMLPASTRLAIGTPERSVSITTRNLVLVEPVCRGRATVSHNGKDLRNLPIEERKAQLRVLTTSARKPPLRSARFEAEIALLPFSPRRFGPVTRFVVAHEAF